MISVNICQENKVQCNANPALIKEAIGAGHPTVWVDVETPTEEDWNLLEEQFHFHPLAMEDARMQRQQSKLDQYEGYLFLSLRAWVGFQSATNNIPDVTDEIDIFLGANYLVTIHQNHCIPLGETRRRWQEHPEMLSNQPAFLLYELLDTIVDDFFPAIDQIDAEIDELETTIYTTTGNIDIAPALRMKKKLLLLRQSIAPMRDMLNQLIRSDQTLIPATMRLYFQDVYDHLLRQVEQVDLHRDIVSGVLEAMMAQTSNHLNQVMKTMTGISTIMMSAALITGIYGMNFQNMPELKTQYGYYIALATMGVVSMILVWFFKRIKWF